MRLLAGLFTILSALFVFSSCGGKIGLPTNSTPTPERITGSTSTEKAVSIASIVSAKNQGFLLVSDARIVPNGVSVVVVDGNSQVIQGSASLWYLMGDAKADQSSNMNGLLYSVYVTKQGSLLSRKDADDAQKSLADLVSLSARTFLQGSAKEFAFLEIVLVSPPFSMTVYHMSAADIIAERNKGFAADWVTFVGNSETTVQQAFLAVGTPASPTPAPKP